MIRTNDKKEILFSAFRVSLIAFSVAVALTIFAVVMNMFGTEGISVNSLYNAGVDIMGSFACAVLCSGFLIAFKGGAEDKSNKWFIILILVTSLSFLNNAFSWRIVGEASYREAYLVLSDVTKILDFALVFCFYRYVRVTLSFDGKLALLADRAFKILLIPAVLLLVINHFHPICYEVDAGTNLVKLDCYWLVDLYMMIVAPVTTILIVKSNNPGRQKIAAFSFIVIPVFHYVLSGGAHGYATQYGSVLLALILMYCIIFNEKSKALAATKVELNTATAIQTAMMPHIFPAFPDRSEFDLYATMDPAKEVGGDFYDYFLIDDDHLCIVMADVSGKGVPAALFMMASKIIIQSCAMLGESAGKILTKTNEAICSNNPEEMFVTVLLGILEISTGKLTYANGGHEYPAFMHRGGEWTISKEKNGLAVGALEGVRYKETTVDLKPGDKIFLYTDGVPEATDKNESMFGMENMLKTLNRSREADPKTILGAMRAAVDEFVGSAEQFDDLTMLCFEYKGNN